MYHSARAAVFVQMHLDVHEHRNLVKRFKKVLRMRFKDDTLGIWLDYWRANRNRCDYNPYEELTRELCEQAIDHAEVIYDTCKNLVEAL